MTNQEKNESKSGSELLENISRQIPGVIYQYRVYPDGRACFPFSSEHIEDIYEVSQKAVQEDAGIILERLHPQDHDRVVQSIKTSQETLEKWEDEYRVVLPEKGERWVRGVAQPERLEDGSVLWHGYIYDITEQKQHQFEQERLKEQFELAVAGTNDGIWDWNLVTNELFLSKRWKEMLGYEDWEIKNEFDSFLSLLYEEDVPRVHDFVQRYLKGQIEQYKIEFRMNHKNGTPVWILAKGEALRDKEGKPYRMAGSHSDIQERKSFEKALVDQNKLQQTLMDIANTFINAPLNEADKVINESLAKLGHFTDTDRSYIFMYDHERGITNNTYEWCNEGIEPQIDELQEVPLDTIPDWVEIHMSGESLYIPDVSALYPDSMVRQILEPQGVKSLLALPMMDGDKCIGFVGFDAVRNHHQFSEKEQSLLFLFSLMLVNLFNRNQTQAELTLAMGQAKAASKAKSEFLANMSHEIRTPLNGIIGFSDLLERSELNQKQREYMNAVKNSAHSLMDIINDILDFSKIEAGKLELNREKTDIIELCENIIDIVKFRAQEKDIELLLDIKPEVPRYAWVDGIRLKQILINLLGNAIKFTEKGHVELKVIRSKQENVNGETIAHILFAVEDTGIGINEKHRERIFDAFSQEDLSTTKKFGGTGLGLAISSQLLMMMGTQLHLSSELGKGSTFDFTLALKTEDLPEKRIAIPETIRNIMIIDDNSNNRALLRNSLEPSGIIITEAKNGFEALEILTKKTDFDLLIIDFRMPYMNGIEVVKTIREKFEISEKELPVILLHSSEENDDLKNDCKQYAISAHLLKPVKMTQLFRTIAGLFDAETLPQDTESVKRENEKDNKLSMTGYKRMLIVEDNPTNMLFAKTTLSLILPNVEIYEAKNGEEAVNIAREEDLDVIFMDVRMPIMDGYEATKKIREFDQETTIIALTAGVIKGEKERCVAAGMNDYLPKPFTFERIEKLLIDNLTANDGDMATITRGAEDSHFFNKSLLTKRLGGYEEIIHQTMVLFHDDLLSKIEKLDGIDIEQEKPETLQLIFHSLKGQASNMCFETLEEEAGKLETLAAKGEKVAISAHLEGFVSILRKSLEIVKQQLI